MPNNWAEELENLNLMHLMLNENSNHTFFKMNFQHIIRAN